MGGALITAGTIINADINPLAAISASKTQTYIAKFYSQVSGTAIVDSAARVIHVVVGASMTITSIKAGWVVQATQGGGDDRHVEVDVLVDGTTVMGGGALDIVKATAAYGLVSGTITDATHSTNQVVAITIDELGSVGTQGQGVFIEVRMTETYPVG